MKKILVLIPVANIALMLASTAFAIDPGAGDGSIICRWKCMRQDPYGVCIEWEQVCTSGGDSGPLSTSPAFGEILNTLPKNAQSFDSKTSATGGIELSNISTN